MAEVVSHSFRDKIISYLQTKPYLTIDMDHDIQVEILLSRCENIEKQGENFIFLYDIESKRLVPNAELDLYIKGRLGHLLEQPEYVSSVSLKSDIFRIIIINISSDTSLSTREFSPGEISYLSGQAILYPDYSKWKPHLLFYDTLAVKRKIGASDQWVNVSIESTLDFADGKILLDMPEFQLIKDFQKEYCIKNPVKGQLTYSEVLPQKSRSDVLINKWKTTADLKKYFNLNKLKYWEINLFRELKIRVTDNEFRKVIGWYRQDGDSSFYDFCRNEYMIHSDDRALSNEIPKLSWEDLYTSYLAHRFKVKTHKINNDDSTARTSEYFIINDYIKNFREARRQKLEITLKSWARFAEEERLIGIEIQNLAYKKFYKRKFNQTKEWKPLLHRLTSSTLDLTHLNCAAQLIEEGNRQGNCVGSYIEPVAQNECLILSYLHKGTQRHTVEVYNVGSPEKPVYKIAQCLTRFNRPAASGAEKALKSVIY